jgi:hypothetical protein
VCCGLHHKHTAPPPWSPQVLFFSFTTIIGIMIGTCYFVFSVGGIRLNGI